MRKPAVNTPARKGTDQADLTKDLSWYAGYLEGLRFIKSEIEGTDAWYMLCDEINQTLTKMAALRARKTRS